MAGTREKQIRRLNVLGEEWYAIDAQSSPAEKKNKFQEIMLLAYNILVPSYFDGTKTVNAGDQDFLDEKLTKVLDLLEEGKRLFDPSKGSLYEFISSRFNQRMKDYKVKQVQKAKRMVDISQITPKDDEGNEMDPDAALTIAAKDYDPFTPGKDQVETEKVEQLHLSLKLMGETFLLHNSAKKISDRKKHIFQLLYSSRLINFAKDIHIPKKGLQHEREFMDCSNQKFFVFCYDSDRQIYVSFKELEQTPLKTNKTVYQLAESCGKHYTLKDNLADSPIQVPIQNNICIMYLVCVEGDEITDPMFSQYRKQFEIQLQSLRQN